MHTPMTGALMMREHVGALRTVLTELARHVTLVWRLEEAVTSDVLPLDRKEKFQRKLTVSHAFFYDLQRQVSTAVSFEVCSQRSEENPERKFACC